MQINKYIKECAEARKVQNFKKADYFMELLLEYDRENPAILLEEALIYKEKRHYEEALNKLFNLLNTSKRNLALMEIGNTYLLMHKFYEAKKYYMILFNEAKNMEESKQSYKDQIYPLQKLALASKRRGLYELAKSLYHEALNLIETNPYGTETDKYFAILELGNIDNLEGNTNDAIDKYLILANTNRHDKYLALLELAKVYVNNHELDLAIPILQEILENSLVYKDAAIFTLGRCEFMNQNYYKALEYFYMLLNTKDHNLAMEQLIYIHYKLENYDTARKFTEELINYLARKSSNKAKVKKFQQLLNIIEIRSGNNNNLSNTGLLLEHHYNANIAIASIKKRYENNETIKINDDIITLFNTIDLNSSNYYGSDLYDNYYITLPNAGYIKDEQTDYLKVTTIVNTKHIIGIYPCKNKNNQLKHVKLKDYKRTLEN